MKKIFTSTLSVKEARELINEGYKYYVECDFTDGNAVDPWGWTLDIENNVAVFVDKVEAEAFAAEQVWPFNPNVHGEVKELRWGETYAEMEARVAREKAERKATKAKAAKRARLKKEITALEKELTTKRAELAKMDA